jgi:uncharacterized protein YndB with AHSA1/START domain
MRTIPAITTLDRTTIPDEVLETLVLPYSEAMITIAKPIDEVFEFLADGVNAPRWMSWVMQSTPVGYVGGVGATYSLRTVSSLLGRHRVVYRTVHYHRPAALGVEATSLPGRPTARFRLTPTESGSTTVTVRAEFKEVEAEAAPDSVSRRWASHLVESLPRIKSELESGAADGDPA